MIRPMIGERAVRSIRKLASFVRRHFSVPLGAEETPI